MYIPVTLWRPALQSCSRARAPLQPPPSTPHFHSPRSSRQSQLTALLPHPVSLPSAHLATPRHYSEHAAASPATVNTINL